MSSALHLIGADVEDTVSGLKLAIIPFGSVEYHGPHAPLGTDSFISQEIAGRVAKQTNSLLYPLVAYTTCPVSTQRKPGTISVDADTMVSYTENIFRGLFDNGLKAILTINAHDSNIDTIGRAADRIFFDYPHQFVLAVNWWQTLPTSLIDSLKLFSDDGGHGHGGPLETSAAWAVAPDTVDLSKAPDRDPESSHTELVRLGFQGRDMDWPGYCGRISECSVDKGETLLKLSVERIVTLVNEWSQT